ncbi:MAG: rane dipeptidase [Actinomycetota bacterium]|nr:rane dipeptidase [Actinomycetota bacterium]
MTTLDESVQATDLLGTSLVWDQHGCLPLVSDAPFHQLRQYADAGVDFVSLNVGFDAIPWTQSLKVLAAFRRWILNHPDDYLLVDTAADVLNARGTARLAVSFDLEGSDALDGDAALVSAYYRLGVRTMLLAYNNRNRAAGGCHDHDDTGLTSFGREVVGEMNRVGMLVDASHCSRRATLDLFETSTAPVVFSHSNARAVHDHERNIDDEQIRGCAATGGVIGINGVGIFLGDNDTRTATVVRHVEHVAGLVGPQHVGLGLDYVFDQDELARFLADNPETFPAGKGYAEHHRHSFVEPSQIREVAVQLLASGWPEHEVRGVLGENFLRVASQVWK